MPNLLSVSGKSLLQAATGSNQCCPHKSASAQRVQCHARTSRLILDGGIPQSVQPQDVRHGLMKDTDNDQHKIDPCLFFSFKKIYKQGS